MNKKRTDISKSTERKVGTILSYVGMALSVAISLLYTPYMIRTVGQSEYGLYNTLSSIIGIIAILELGFTSSYIKYYSKYVHDNEYDKLKSFNTLFTTIFTIIACITLILGLLCSFNLKLIYHNGFTNSEYREAKIMLILMSISMSIGYATTIFPCYVGAHQRFIFSKVLGLINTLLTVLLNIICLILGYGVMGIVVVSLIITIMSRLIHIYYSTKKLDLRFDFNYKNIEKGLFKKVFNFSGLIAINIFVDKVNAGLDAIILGRFCGTSIAGIYAVGSALNTMNTNFSTAISGIFTSHIHELVNSYEMDSKEQRKILTEFFTKVGRIQFLLMALICSGVIIFGRQFIYFWAGEGYEDAYYVALLLIVPGIIPLIQNVGIEIQRAENRHHYRSYIYGVMALINLIISIIFCQFLDAVGCALGTCIAVVVANGIIMNIIYHKKINIDMIYFWKNILRQTVGMIIPFICGILIMKFYEIDSIIKLIAGIAVYSLIYCVFVWFFSMNNYEKNIIKDAISKIFKKAKV